MENANLGSYSVALSNDGKVYSTDVQFEIVASPPVETPLPTETPSPTEPPTEPQPQPPSGLLCNDSEFQMLQTDDF